MTGTAHRRRAPAAPPRRQTLPRSAADPAHNRSATRPARWRGGRSGRGRRGSPAARPPTTPAPPAGSPSPPARKRCWTHGRCRQPADPAAAREPSPTGIPFSLACSFDRRSSTTDMIEQATLIYRNGRTRPRTGLLLALAGAAWFMPVWIGWHNGPAGVRTAAMLIQPVFLPLVCHVVVSICGGGKRLRVALTLLYVLAATLTFALLLVT